MTITDTHGLAYETTVGADVPTTLKGNKSPPMALYALRGISGHSRVVDNDISEVKSLLERAFGNKCQDATAAAVIRTFPTDTADPYVCKVLSTESSNTSLFSDNHTPSHNMVVHTARISQKSSLPRGTGSGLEKVKPIQENYIASQSVTIEEVGGIYTASIVMTRNPLETELDSEDNHALMATPLVPYARSDSRCARLSAVHLFTAGRHFAANVVHTHDSDLPRSLHLPVYAVMHAIAELNPKLSCDIKRTICAGSMDTLHTDPSTPTIVMRNSSTPMVAFFAACLDVQGHNRNHFEDQALEPAPNDEEWEQLMKTHSRGLRRDRPMPSNLHDYSEDDEQFDTADDADIRSNFSKESTGSNHAWNAENKGIDHDADSRSNYSHDSAEAQMNYSDDDETHSNDLKKYVGDNDPETRTRTGVTYPDNVRMALMRHWS